MTAFCKGSSQYLLHLLLQLATTAVTVQNPRVTVWPLDARMPWCCDFCQYPLWLVCMVSHAHATPMPHHATPMPHPPMWGHNPSCTHYWSQVKVLSYWIIHPFIFFEGRADESPRWHGGNWTSNLALAVICFSHLAASHITNCASFNESHRGA